MITVFGISIGGRPAPEAVMERKQQNASRRGRNMRVFLLRIRRLSRRNCCSSSASPTKGEFWPPRGQRAKRDIQKPALEHEQKGYREELPVNNREPDEIREIDSKTQFGER